MKFLFPNKLEAAASKEASRYTIAHVFLDVPNCRAIATDGHILTVHPVETVNGDVSGWLTREALEAYRKASKKFDRGLQCLSDCLIVTDSQGAETRYPRPAYSEGNFPNYQAVMPARESIAEKPVITVNFELLKRLVESLGYSEDSREKMIAIFPSDNNRAHVVKTAGAGAIGVIMPLRASETEWKLTLQELEAKPEEHGEQAAA